MKRYGLRTPTFAKSLSLHSASYNCTASNMALALLLIGAEAAGPATTDELHRLEARFEERLSALQSQMDLLRQENAELRQGRGGARTAADEGGRRLSQEGRRLNPASQRIMWHNGMLHRFDVPNTCGLDANLHKSDGPLMIQRSPDGNLTMLYDSTGVAMQTTAPIEVTHPSGCASKTLTLDGDVEIVGGLTVGSPTCVKVQVPTATNSDGYITLSVRDSLTPDYPGRVVTAGWATLGDVVFETCFNGFRQLLVHSGDSDAWVGTIYYSNDGGATYDQPLLCLTDNGGFCKLESTSSSVYTGTHASAAGTSDGVGADKEVWGTGTFGANLASGLVCDRARRCSFVKPDAQTCMKLDVTNAGFLKVRVIDSRSTSATDWKAVTDDSHSAARDAAAFTGDTTLAFCFDGFQKLGVSNTDSNAINVDVTVSTDAGVTFDKYMNCAGCHSGGSQGGVAKLTVDGDAGTTNHDTAGMICEDGNWCELTVA